MKGFVIGCKRGGYLGEFQKLGLGVVFSSKGAQSSPLLALLLFSGTRDILLTR